MARHSAEQQIVIIGAGVVGSAIAYELSTQGYQNILILERHSRPAEGVTSRNSGVIHAGIYYPPQSLKAKLCTEGLELLYELCHKTSLSHKMTGKLIVATEASEDEELSNIFQNAVDSGAKNLRHLPEQEFKGLLPFCQPTSCLYSPRTGIIDPSELTHYLLNQSAENGAMAIYDCHITQIEKVGTHWQLQTSKGNIECEVLINAAGLHADEVAKMAGVSNYEITPWRGDYFWLRTREKYQHLIYPVKGKNAAGLGVHLTLTLDGKYRLGPDVELYHSKTDFSARPEKIETFRRSAEKLLGPIQLDQLSYDQCGIRPKLRKTLKDKDGDFVISEDLPGLINLIGIESPGLTSCLAIAKHVYKQHIK